MVLPDLPKSPGHRMRSQNNISCECGFTNHIHISNYGISCIFSKMIHGHFLVSANLKTPLQ